MRGCGPRSRGTIRRGAWEHPRRSTQIDYSMCTRTVPNESATDRPSTHAETRDTAALWPAVAHGTHDRTTGSVVAVAAEVENRLTFSRGRGMPALCLPAYPLLV